MIDAQDMLTAALWWAARGVPVFPGFEWLGDRCACGRTDCDSPAKHPRVKWREAATTDPDKIAAYWKKWPTASVLGAMGDSGAWVLDVDAGPGKQGPAALEDWESIHGRLPPTFTIRTGGGGRHLYFRMPDGRKLGNRAGVLQDVDARGTGGYVVLPPSTHASGQRYQLLDESEIADPPLALLDLVAPLRGPRPAQPLPSVDYPDGGQPAQRVRGMLLAAAERIRTAPEGTRQDTANRECYGIGGYLHASGLTIEDVAPILVAAVEQADQDPEVVYRALQAGAESPRPLPPDRPLPTKPRPAPPPDEPEPPLEAYEPPHDPAEQESADAGARGLDRLAALVLLVTQGDALAKEASALLIDGDALTEMAEAMIADQATVAGYLQRARLAARATRGVDALVQAIRQRAIELLRERGGPPIRPDEALELTDLGNAARFDRAWGQDVLWSAQRGEWLIWTGRCWAVDTRARVQHYAQDTVRRLRDEARKMEELVSGPQARLDLEDRLKALKMWAHTSQGRPRIEAIPAMAKSLPGRAVGIEELDCRPFVWNAHNASIDLAERRARPHDRRDRLTQCSPVPFDQDAQCPTWRAFLRSLFPDDGSAIDDGQQVIDFLQRAIGYTLTGTVGEHVFFVLQGDGSNGKSTFLETIAHLFGAYAISLPSGFFEETANDRHPTELAGLQGRRLAHTSEVKPDANIDESKIKRLTGGDTISARFMGQNFFEFAPNHKLWIAANHLLGVRSTDWGIWRRMVIVDFRVQIAEDRKDRDLPAKLRDEAPGILNWALDGFVQWQRLGLGVPDRLTRNRDGHRRSQDTLGLWLEQCTRPDVTRNEEDERLYASYRQWSERTQTRRPMSLGSFVRVLEARGYTRAGGRIPAHRGIEILH